MYDFTDTHLPQEQQTKLNAALATHNAELEALNVRRANALSEIGEADAALKVAIKAAYDAVAVVVEAESLTETGEFIGDIMTDITNDILYEWTSNRPLEFELDDDGTVEFWEPSSC